MSGTESAAAPGLVRRLGPFDATMLVMGGIIGAGIFVNPAEVARYVHTPGLIVGVWMLGGLIAMAGALVYAELADRRPGCWRAICLSARCLWADPGIPLWLVAAAGDPVGRHGGGGDHIRPLFPRTCAASAARRHDRCRRCSLLLVAINCLGVRAGGTVQSGLMVLKIVAIAMLVIGGWWFASANPDFGTGRQATTQPSAACLQPSGRR